MDDHVALCLSRDHAIVLFEWLARTSAAGLPVNFADQAEQRALWTLESDLEALLPEVLADDYRERVAEARASVRDPS